MGEALAAWLARRGASIGPLSVAPDPTAGRTVVAAAPIAADGVVLRIPLPLLLTTEVGRAIVASGMDPPGYYTFLAAYLLEERARPRSRFRRYLQSLPAAFPTLP